MYFQWALNIFISDHLIFSFIYTYNQPLSSIQYRKLKINECVQCFFGTGDWKPWVHDYEGQGPKLDLGGSHYSNGHSPRPRDRIPGRSPKDLASTLNNNSGSYFWHEDTKGYNSQSLLSKGPWVGVSGSSQRDHYSTGVQCSNRGSRMGGSMEIWTLGSSTELLPTVRYLFH